MKIDSFEYPINWESNKIVNSEVYQHHDAQSIGKEFKEDKVYERCTCCHRRIGEKGKLSLCENIEEKYGKYGPNTVIFLGVMFRLYFLTLVCTLIYSMYSLIVNFQGKYCNTKGLCSLRNLIYYQSVYNVLDDTEIQFTQLVIWCVMTPVILGFNLYMR